MHEKTQAVIAKHSISKIQTIMSIQGHVISIPEMPAPSPKSQERLGLHEQRQKMDPANFTVPGETAPRALLTRALFWSRPRGRRRKLRNDTFLENFFGKFLEISKKFPKNFQKIFKKKRNFQKNFQKKFQKFSKNISNKEPQMEEGQTNHVRWRGLHGKSAMVSRWPASSGGGGQGGGKGGAGGGFLGWKRGLVDCTTLPPPPPPITPTNSQRKIYAVRALCVRFTSHLWNQLAEVVRSKPGGPVYMGKRNPPPPFWAFLGLLAYHTHRG